MATKGRDLKVNILSDVDQFDVSKPADDLEKLGQSAKDSGDDIEKSLKDSSKDLDKFTADTADTARKVDRAFEKIAASSKSNIRKKLDDDTDHAKGSLKDVGDEAGDTAREMGASFSGSATDVQDAFQELAANAGAAFGPIGIAAGVAASVGVGMITAEAEKLKEQVSDLVDEMIDQGGRISKSFIDNNIKELSLDGTISQIEELGEKYGLTEEAVRDLIRARAGDEEAMGRVQDALKKETERRKTSTDEMSKSEARVTEMKNALGDQADAINRAKKAYDQYARSTNTASDSLDEAKTSWRQLHGAMKDPVTAKVRVQKPSSGEVRGIRNDIINGIGPIVVGVYVKPKYDQSTFSRFRPRP